MDDCDVDEMNNGDDVVDVTIDDCDNGGGAVVVVDIGRLKESKSNEIKEKRKVRLK